MSLGGKYAFATVMFLVLPMCILINCSSVLCVLMALGMFMSSLISVTPPPCLCSLSVRMVVYFSFLCEIYLL